MNECNIVKDLLPLYAEHMTSEDSNRMIEEHLKTCNECRQELERIQKEENTVINDDQMSKSFMHVSQKFRKNRLETILLTASIACTVFLTLFAWLSAPIWLTYKEAVKDAQINENSIVLTLNEKVTDYKVYTFDMEGEEIQNIECWTTMLDQMLKTKKENEVTLDKQKIFYVNNDSKINDVLIYGEMDGGRITLRRLTLNYYLLISFAAAAVMSVIWFIFRKKKSGITLLRLLLIPLSWIIANFLVERGIGSSTYSFMRDFVLILMTWVSLMVMLNILVNRKYTVIQ